MFQKTPSRKWKDNWETGRKYLQIIIPITSLYPEYIKDYYKSVIKEKYHNLEIGKGYGHFSKETHKWTKEHMRVCSTPSVQIKTKLQWDILHTS